MALSAANGSFSSPSSSSTPPWKYHFFLSFRGKDTRKGLAEDIHAAWKRQGMRPYKDDKDLKRGEHISQALPKAIEDSLSAIVILSPNFASSTWCLDELQKILESKNTRGLDVLPIFYGVDRSEVRHQTGRFGEAFKKPEERYRKDKEKVQRWRDALKEIADLSGWNCKNQEPNSVDEDQLLEDLVSGAVVRDITSINPVPMALSPANGSFSSSSSSSIPPWKHHIFLSFRSVDTRRFFTSHLYAALNRQGMINFMDCEEPRIGKNIPQPPLKAIEDSLSAIVILSPHYASSTWCLNQLQKILESEKTLGRHVFPIFRGVDPSEARYLKGRVEKAVMKLEQRYKEDEVKRWTEALEEIADIYGWHCQNQPDSKINEELLNQNGENNSCKSHL